MMRTFNDRIGAGIPERHLGNFSIPSGFILDVRPDFLTPDEYFGWDVRHIAIRSPKANPDVLRYHGELDPGALVNEWGVAFLPGFSHHYTRRVGPLREMTSAAELRTYPFPDPMEPSNHADLDFWVDAIHEDGLAAAAFMQQTLFELAWEMRGMEKFLLDLVTNQDFVENLLDRITEIRCKMAARYAAAGVDLIRLGDDFGTQHSLMMSPQTFRDVFKPRLKAIIDAAKQENPDVLIFFHSDGSITPLVGDFIDMGVDVLNPVQPECVDLAFLKREYGDRLSFWGGIGIQRTMPFGTREEVKEATRKVIESLGEGGGLVVAPTHALQPDVPWENVEALFEGVDEFGWY
jgi:uroporphyrinogen decarboxylase